MPRKPARSRQRAAWLAVCLWSLLIFLTIPLARPIVQIVAGRWGRLVFAYAVLAAVVIALFWALGHLVRRRTAALLPVFCLAAAASVFVAYTVHLSRSSPEEAIHFVQYGVLSVLVFRALALRRPCVATYFCAAVICGIIGTVDEVVQWLVPGRYWGLRDVWINFFAAALVQIALAAGLRPIDVAARPGLENIRLLCRLLAAAALLLGVCLLNTPARIAWYAERIPGLGYLKNNESVMAEYGHRHSDPEIGVFQSRLSIEALGAADRGRSVEAAAILDIYRTDDAYADFLGIYTPVSAPFVHEARVHLFSRDRNLSEAMAAGADAGTRARRLTSAFRENQIMETYFARTLAASGYLWPAHVRDLAEKHLQQDRVFVSWVSRHLITAVTESQVAVFFASIVLGLALLNRYLARLADRR